MKNNILFLLAVVSVLTISSCKKKIESCKLGKSYLSDGNTTPNPNTFYYYSDGRLQKIVYTNKTKDSLAYYADTIDVHTFDALGSLTSVFTGVLNANGDVTAGTKTSFDNAGTVTSTEDYSLVYNAGGNLTQKTITNSGGTTLLNLNYNGSNSATGALFIGGVLDRSYTFYHSSVENKTGIDDLNGVLTPYFGRPSKNLLDSTRIITATADTIRIQYAHTLDANEYVSKTIETYLTHGVDTKYFTYQYFDCSK